MRIFVTGTRGIPDIPGGVEKHCQELYPLIAAAGHEIIIATRSSYVNERVDSWHGIRLSHLYAPRNKSMEAIIHTMIAVLKARFVNADLVHVHAVGPGLLVPLARMLGLKVVVTNHGPDYDREKWGSAAKKVLRLGEYLGGKFANEVIVISSLIGGIVKRRCGRDVQLIYNGVTVPEKSKKKDFLEEKGVEPGNYIFTAARFVPEKGLHDLIDAFVQLNGKQQLVIAGDADHETSYSRSLKQLAAKYERIVLTGYVTGETLNQLFTHARLFVLPSTHEGLPIALLEAMSFGLPVVVSDIPANREVDLPLENYYKCSMIKDLKDKIKLMLAKDMSGKELAFYKKLIREKYNWKKIAEQTLSVYYKVVGES